MINELKKFSSFDGSFVFFVSPKKINKIIPELKKIFSGRQIIFCREISKLYEEYLRRDIDNLELFASEPKGELTIIISENKLKKNTSQNLSESDKRVIKKMIKIFSTKEITNFINENRPVAKKEIYDYCLKLKHEN